MREDPVRKRIGGRPDLDTILTLYPQTQGPPAFDPGRIAEAMRSLRTHPPVNTGHSFLDRSVKAGLAHIDATFRGDHPKYGVGTYAREEHDGFPPTIIAAVDALSAWGLNERARRLFRYWLVTFVKDDGRIRYYGPSIAEYGQLLHTAALLEERAGPADWWGDGFRPWIGSPSTCSAPRRRGRGWADHLVSRRPTLGRTPPAISTTTPGWSRASAAGPNSAGAGMPPQALLLRRPGKSRENSPGIPSGPSRGPGPPIPLTGGCRPR